MIYYKRREEMMISLLMMKDMDIEILEEKFGKLRREKKAPKRKKES